MPTLVNKTFEKTAYSKTNIFLFSLFVIVCLLDPSNTIFKSKEILFVLFCFHGILNFFNNFNKFVFIYSIFFSLIFPFIYLFTGMFINYNYSQEIAIENVKVFFFLIIINFVLDIHTNFSNLFSILTYVLIPASLIVFISLLTENFGTIESFIGDYTKTVMIATRDFGNNSFIMIYYKTVSLLIFGLTFSLSLSKGKLRNLLIFFSTLILFLSGTRANLISIIIIISIYIYIKYCSKSFMRRFLYFLTSIILLIIYSSKFILTFFDKNEDSFYIKFSFISDYFTFWHNNPMLLIFGEGFGGGILTKERGLSYNLETTYFELVRIFGIFGFTIIFILLLFPFLFYFRNKSKLNIAFSDRLFLLSYFCYVFIIIPSNPLFLSSTGMLVLIITYSLIYKYYKKRTNLNASDIIINI